MNYGAIIKMLNYRLMKRLKDLLLILCVLVLSSCHNKQQPVSDLQAFATELREHSADYTNEDWQKAEQKMDEINESLSQYQYTDEEQQKIGELKGRCWMYFTKRAVKSSVEQVKQFANEMKGAIKGFSEEVDEDSDSNN